jgi:thymidylate kinase
MDGSGKTTLIERLRTDFDNLYIVRNQLNDQQDFEHWWPKVMDVQKSDRVPIHDRFFFSEIVYGPVLRGNINAPPALVTNVAFALRNLALLIYARPHSDILRQGFRSNLHMDGVEENFQSLLEMYDNVMMVERSWFRDRFIRYDWNEPSSYLEVQVLVTQYLKGMLY